MSIIFFIGFNQFEKEDPNVKRIDLNDELVLSKTRAPKFAS